MFRNFLSAGLVVLGVLAFQTASSSYAQDRPKLQKTTRTDLNRDDRIQAMRIAAIRHQLLTLPYYDVFDWLDADVRPDGKVTLRGEVVRTTTKTDAEARVRKIESVTGVVNEIKVLPPSSTDDGFRIALYRAIYNWNSPLFRYAMRAVPPIHVIVENGRVTLKGVVASQSDSQLAYTAARQIPGLFDVRNELLVEN